MKKAIIFMLVAIVLLSTFSACTPQSDNDNVGVDTSADSQSSGGDGLASIPSQDLEKDPAESTPAEDLKDLYPNLNLDEKEVNIVSRNHPWNIDEVKVETQNADPINDAIYDRNINVEKALNVKIKNTLIPSGISENFVVVDELKKTSGPDCPYHIVANNAYTSFANISEGYFKNLRDVAYLDLSKDYWAPYFNPEASIGNRQYFATGAASLTLYRMIFVTFFNKDLATYYNLENLYDVVDDGRWTLDYQAKIVSNMWSEEDGRDGKTEGDTYGFLTDDGLCVDVYISACDVQILVKDKDDFYTFTPQKERADEMMSKINNLYRKSGGTYVFDRQGDYSQFDKMHEKFASGEATMITERLMTVENEVFRNMDMPYGIIPIPKLNEAQSSYYSHAHDQFTIWGIVNSAVTDPIVDELGAVLEALAIESKRTVTPAYYEVALKGKYSKDTESWAMLDMIVGSLKINGGCLYTTKLDNLSQKFRDAVTAKRNDTTFIFNAVKLQQLNLALERLQNDIKIMQSEE